MAMVAMAIKYSVIRRYRENQKKNCIVKQI